MIMAGAYPGEFDDRANDKQLKTILNKGVDTFVCLQLEVDEDVPEAVWRAGEALRPYFPDARKISKKTLIWRHLPILDGDCAEDDVMEALVCDLLDDVKAGRVLYVHCLGGHGRTGIVVALMLAVMYGLNISEAFKRIQAYHDCRIEPQGVKSPSTVCQRSQVKRLLEKWKNNQREGPGGATTPPEEQVSNINQPPAPQVVIGKNGARGFIVPPEKNTNLFQMGRDMNNDIALNRKPSKGQQQGKQPIMLQTPPTGSQGKNINLQLCPDNRKSNSSLPTTQISMHRPGSAARLGKDKAAGGGVAAIQMIRKASAPKCFF